MKISFVLGHELPFPPAKGGGVNSLLDGLTRALARAGHEVTAYSPVTPGRPDVEVVAGVRHVRVQGAERRPGNLKNVVAGIPYALRVWKTIEPCDVLSGHLLHGFLFTGHPKAKIVTHTIHRDPKKFLLLFSQLDRIYTGSDAVTEEAAQVVPRIARKLKTVYNCVDFAGYETQEPRPADGKVRFLFVGRFSRDKGLDVFIPAFCRAARQDASLTMKTLGPMKAEGGGDEGLLAEMQAFVKGEGLEDRVQFAEPVFTREQIDAEIRNCDVVCLPSVGGETLNMSIIESMRIGRALLISDLPANLPLTEEGHTGWFARAGDGASWERKITEISAQRELLPQVGSNAYRFGLEKFSADKVAADYIADFSALLDAKGCGTTRRKS
jgi:glycosyltransferase involved in cell wall biosynthesis